MRKLFNIILCLSILTASFDIIDTNDITVNGNPVFHSQNMDDNQNNDSLELDGAQLTSATFFHINAEYFTSIYIPFVKNTEKYVFTDDPLYNNYSTSLYRPPIA